MKDAHKSHTPEQNKNSFIKQLAYLLHKRGFKLVVTDAYNGIGQFQGGRYAFESSEPPTVLSMDDVYEMLPAELTRSNS